MTRFSVGTYGEPLLLRSNFRSLPIFGLIIMSMASGTAKATRVWIHVHTTTDIRNASCKSCSRSHQFYQASASYPKQVFGFRAAYSWIDSSGLTLRGSDIGRSTSLRHAVPSEISMGKAPTFSFHELSRVQTLRLFKMRYTEDLN